MAVDTHLIGFCWQFPQVQKQNPYDCLKYSRHIYLRVRFDWGEARN